MCYPPTNSNKKVKFSDVVEQPIPKKSKISLFGASTYFLELQKIFVIDNYSVKASAKSNWTSATWTSSTLK